jgi:hypothetical protein
MTVFNESIFDKQFNFANLDRTVAATVRMAVKNPSVLYLFFQRYTYFNGYSSAMISRLASSIGMSRYLFNNSELIVTEEADRGMEIAAKIMTAAADEGAHDTPVHRALAQLTLKTVGDYAELSADERNQFAKIPNWLDLIVREVIDNYQGNPNDMASLIRGMGMHLASEMLGDREYSLIDMIVRRENKGIGLDLYLKNNHNITRIGKHNYTAWTWVVIHSQHDKSGVELEHYQDALEALNMSLRYVRQSEQQILAWAQEGFATFVKLQQSLFREIYNELLTFSENPSRESLVLMAQK